MSGRAIAWMVGAIGLVFALTLLSPVASWRANSLALTANDKLHHGDGAAARQLALNALELSEECASAHLVLGELAAREGHYEEAVIRYGRASKLDPLNPVAALGYATFLEKTGTYDKAKVAYDDVIRKFQGTEEAGVASLKLRTLPRR